MLVIIWAVPRSVCDCRVRKRDRSRSNDLPRGRFFETWVVPYSSWKLQRGSAGRGKHYFDEEDGLFHYIHFTNGMAFSGDIFTNPGYTDLGGNSYSYMQGCKYAIATCIASV